MNMNLAIFRKIFVYFAIGVVVLLLLTEVLLYFGGTPLARWVIDKFNQQQPGEARVEAVRVSFLRSFPRVGLCLKGFTYYEHKPAQRPATEKPILLVGDLDVGVNPWQLLWKEIRVTKIALDTGYVGLIVYPDSSVNLLNALGDLVEALKATPDDALDKSDDSFAFLLKKMSLEGLQIALEDQLRGRGLHVWVQSLEHSLSYRSKEIKNALRLKAVLDTLAFQQETLLERYPIELVARFRLDRIDYAANVQKLTARFGNIHMQGSGTYDHLDSSRTDASARLDVRDLDLRPLIKLGFLDQAFITDFIRGHLQAEGNLKGRMAAERPVADFSFQVDSLQFDERSGRPFLEHMTAKGHFKTGEKPDMSDGAVVLNPLDVRLFKGFVKGFITVQNFVNPTFDFSLAGDNNLGQLSRFVSTDPVTNLDGRVKVDLIAAGSYDRNDPYGLQLREASGSLVLDHVSFALPDNQLQVKQLDLDLQQNGVTEQVLNHLFVQINNSDFTVTGALHQLIPYYFGARQDISGNLSMASKLIVCSDFVSAPFLLRVLDPQFTDTYCEIAFEGDSPNRIQGRLLPNGYIDFKRFHTNRSASPDIRKVRGRLTINPDKMGISGLTAVVGESDVRLRAVLRNHYYLLHLDEPKDILFNFSAQSDQMRTIDFMVLNGQYVGPVSYEKESMKNFEYLGSYTFNNQELKTKKTRINSTFRIDRLNFDLSLFPASVVDLKMILHQRDNQLQLEKLTARVGQSDLSIEGYLRRNAPAGDVGPLQLSDFSTRVDIRAHYLNLDELRAINDAEEEGVAVNTVSAGGTISRQEMIDRQLAGENIFAGSFPDAAFSLHIDSVRISQKMLRGIQGKLALSPAKVISLEDLMVRTGAGSVSFSGRIDAQDPMAVALIADGRFQEADLSKIKVPFTYDSVTYVIADNFGGTINGNMHLEMGLRPDMSFSLTDDLRSTIDFSWRNGQINNFGPMLLMADFLGTKDLYHVLVDTIKNTITLEGGVLSIPLMEINSTIGHLRMAGIQDINGDMEYLFQVPLSLVSTAAWNYLTGKDRKEDAGEDEIQIGDDNTFYISTRVVGNISDYKIKLGKGKNFRDMVREARKARKEAKKTGG